MKNDYFRNKISTHRKLTIIITGVVFGLACALALALLPLYLLRHDPELSTQNSMYLSYT